MKKAILSQKIFLSAFLILLISSCHHNRPVVPYEVYADEVYKALTPNDENLPTGATFGPDSIAGFTYDVEFTTNDSDVYVFFNSFTLLDVNPNITQNIFEFIQKELADYGFVNQSFSLNSDEMGKLMAEGLSYQEAAGKILDTIENAFEDQMATYENIDHFNMTFMIYPVYLSKNYVTYRETAYSYTGGAHGMTNSYLRTYDLSSGKLMTLNDIVKAEGLEKVREEVASQMAYSYPIYENITTVEQYLDSLNVWLDHFDPLGITGDITMKNFPITDPAITSEGLAFVYQMYELTPGADGCPLIVVPYKDIEGCLLIE